MGSIGAGPQGGIRFISPSYTTFSKNITLLAADLNTYAEFEYPGFIGQQTINMIYGNIFAWQFSLVGGTTQTTQQIFPNDSNSNYDQSLTYRINDVLPIGCILTAQPLVFGTSSRINKFILTETVTGLNLSFILAYSPYFPINPTIQLISPNIAFLPLTITTSNLLVNQDNRPIGFQRAFQFPTFYTQIYYTLFADGVLDDLLPHPFTRFNGQQIIRITNNLTGFQLAFEIDYGINAVGAYIGLTDPNCMAKLINTISGCNVTMPVIPNNYSQYNVVTFTVNGNDGRSYLITIQPNPIEAIVPTITLIGPLLGAATLNVDLLTKIFNSI
jgi:hypothetical protein